MIVFTIDDEHVKPIYEWIDTHECAIRGKYQGAIGGGTTFSFTNTSIGQVQTVKCACGKDYYIDNHL
jgi:hypothetical protein